MPPTGLMVFCVACVRRYAMLVTHVTRYVTPRLCVNPIRAVTRCRVISLRKIVPLGNCVAGE